MWNKLSILLLVGMLFACSNEPDNEIKYYGIYGDVIGLTDGATATIVNNGTESIELTNGASQLLFTVAQDSNYLITATAPDHSCATFNNNGKAVAEINDVVVDCSHTILSLGGSVQGLIAGDTITISTNGQTAVVGNGDDQIFFNLPSGTEYNILVDNSDGYVCTVSKGIGVLDASKNDVLIYCVKYYYIKGDITGLDSGHKVNLTTNNRLATLGNGTNQTLFYLPTGTDYKIIATATGYVCEVVNATGTIASADVTNVKVNCLKSHIISGNITGMLGTDTVNLTTNGQSIDTGNATNKILFNLPVGTNYDIIATATGYICKITNGKGTLTADVSNVAVNCIKNLKISGTISGLSAGTNVLLSTNSQSISLSNGTNQVFFTLPTGSSYNIKAISTGHFCEVKNGRGILTTDITNVEVVCSQGLGIEGVVAGLASGDKVAITTNGNTIELEASKNLQLFFTFPAGTTYDIIASSPGYVCRVENGTGQLMTNVQNVAVICRGEYKIYGEVAGLIDDTEKIILSTNGQEIAIGNTSSETVLFELPNNKVYDIMATSPGYVCVVNNGTGLISGADVHGVMVNCVEGFTISGIVKGLLDGEDIIVSSNGQNTLVQDTNGATELFFSLPKGTNYDVVVLAEDHIVCEVINGVGVLNTDVDNVVVDCMEIITTSAGFATNCTGNIDCAGGTPDDIRGYVNGAVVDARFYYTNGMAVDKNTGNIYLSDYGNNAIRMIDRKNTLKDKSDDTVITIAGAGVGCTTACPFDNDGNPSLEFNAGYVNGAVADARFYFPGALAIDSTGKNLYVVDGWNQSIRKIDLVAGQVSTVAGAGVGCTTACTTGLTGYINGAAADSRFAYPSGIAIDNTNSFLYIGDNANNVIRRVDLTTSQVSTIAGPGTAGATYPNGCTTDCPSYPYAPFGYTNGLAPVARFYYPSSVEIDRTNNFLYITDSGNWVIRKLDIATGNVTTAMGRGSTSCVAMDCGLADSPGNGPAEGPVEDITITPGDLAVDSKGNVFVVSYNDVRMINVNATPGNNTDDMVSIYAGSGCCGYVNWKLRESRFNVVGAIDLGENENIFTADWGNHVVRRIPY